MKIQEIGTLNLNETTFKLNPNSITAKANGKTKAVINDIQSVASLPFNRKVDLNVKFQTKLNKFFDSLYIDNSNNLYYIINQAYHRLTCEMAAHGDNTEFLQLVEKTAQLQQLNVNVLYLEVA